MTYLIELADLIGDDLRAFVAADQQMVGTALDIGGERARERQAERRQRGKA